MEKKKESKEKSVNHVDQSIHPRVVNGRTAHPKSNTCKPYKKAGKGKLGRKMAELNRRRNAHSSTIKQVKNAAAFKTPASMKG